MARKKTRFAKFIKNLTWKHYGGAALAGGLLTFALWPRKKKKAPTISPDARPRKAVPGAKPLPPTELAASVSSDGEPDEPFNPAALENTVVFQKLAAGFDSIKDIFSRWMEGGAAKVETDNVDEAYRRLLTQMTTDFSACIAEKTFKRTDPSATPDEAALRAAVVEQFDEISYERFMEVYSGTSYEDMKELSDEISQLVLLHSDRLEPSELARLFHMQTELQDHLVFELGSAGFVE